MEDLGQKKASVALIGCGAISRKHVIAINRLRDLEIVGAYDTEAAALKAFAQQHSIPTFTDVDRMVDEANLAFFGSAHPIGCAC